MKADHILVAEAKRGSKEAFSQLVQRHQKVMLRVALRMTRDLEAAEDIVQDSFIKAFRKIDMFEGRSSFKSWMYQITVNTTRNKLRTKRMDQVNIDNVTLSTESKVDDQLMQLDLSQLLKNEVSRLPNKQRWALTLRIFEDLSFKEISQIMECPYDTAKANYRHGLMRLRHRFQENVELRQLQGLSETLPKVFDSGLAEVKA